MVFAFVHVRWYELTHTIKLLSYFQIMGLTQLIPARRSASTVSLSMVAIVT